ncbi:RNA polymerase sigma factor [Pseudonocardia nantongensis]|uniref:RNA polymerase sigma factor n=1 Tax=Pseudonocardia nantongensis TaxID=1181885 RepID=UPI00397E3BA6
MAQRHGADGVPAGPGRAAEPGYDAWAGQPVPPDQWTGGEPPPISGAMVQQHRTLPHGELRADYGAHLEAHYPRLVAQLYAITLSPQDAHDAVQDAYSRAWRRWTELRSRDDDGPEDAAVGWVRRVAIRTSMRGRLLRPRRRRASEESDPRTAALLDALGRLAPADRRAVVLHHMAGLPAGAVGALERVSEQTVRARLARGREVVTEGMAEALDEIVGPAGTAEGGRG